MSPHVALSTNGFFRDCAAVTNKGKDEDTKLEVTIPARSTLGFPRGRAKGASRQC